MITLRQRSSVLIFAAAMGVGPLRAAKNTPPPTANVTSIVHDQDTSGNQLTFQSDDYGTSGGFASYTTTGGVSSVIGNGGGWTLNLFNQSLRTVHLTFTTADGSAPIPQNGYYWENVEIYSQCYDPSGNQINFLAITAGTTAIRCRFAFDFTDQGTKYKMAMGQFQLAGPANGVAMVTCNSSSNGSCNSWTIMPNTGAPLPTIANLYQFGRSGSLVFLGQYVLTFRVDVTLP